MSENKITYGLEGVHIAFKNNEGSYNTPEPVKGAVGWTPSPEGESQIFYADNMAYYISNSNNGYSSELEMANIPDEILAKMLGWEIDNNGMLVEIADAEPKKFALLGQVQGDKRNRRFVYYDVQANRPSKENTTKNENKEPNTDTLPVTVSPVKVGEKVIVKGDMELSSTNQVAYDNFFTSVYEPQFTSVLGSISLDLVASDGSILLGAQTSEPEYTYYYTSSSETQTPPNVNDDISTIVGATIFATDTIISGPNETPIYVQVYKVEKATGRIKAYGEANETPTV